MSRFRHVKRTTVATATGTPSAPDSADFSPRELAARWQCSRSSVERIARRAAFTRVCLGQGHNAMVRYPKAEVLAYEASRRSK
jgi:hypothetical protein